MKSLYDALDRVLAQKINHLSVGDDVEEAKAYNAEPAIQEMNTEFTALDTKASALIAHLPLMIAAVSVIHGSIEDAVLRQVFLVEIMYYTATLLIILRVVFYSYYSDIAVKGAPGEVQPSRVDSLMAELKKRMAYYRLGHALASIGTLILLFSLVAAFWLEPAVSSST